MMNTKTAKKFIRLREMNVSLFLFVKNTAGPAVGNRPIESYYMITNIDTEVLKNEKG